MTLPLRLWAAILWLSGCGRIHYAKHDATLGDAGPEASIDADSGDAGDVGVDAPPSDADATPDRMDATQDDADAEPDEGGADGDATLDDADADPSDADAAEPPDADADLPDADAMPPGGPLDRVHDGLVRVTASAPMLRTPAPTSGDCGQFLMALMGESDDDLWAPRPFAHSDGSVYFTVPCKYGDSGGWSLGLARFTPPSIVGEWLDGNTSTAGVNEFITRFDVARDAMAMGSMGGLPLASSGATLFGVGMHYRGGAFVGTPVLFTGDPISLDVLDFDTARTGEFTYADNDSSPYGSTGVARTVTAAEGLFIVYTRTYNAPTNDASYIVTSSTDGAAAPTRLGVLSGFTIVFMAAYDDGDPLGRYHFVGRRVSTGAWEYWRSTSPIAAMPSQSVALDLGRFLPPRADWDYTFFEYYAVSFEPKLIGITIHDGVLDLYYMAGSFDYGPGTSPYLQPRGIGILRATL